MYYLNAPDAFIMQHILYHKMLFVNTAAYIQSLQYTVPDHLTCWVPLISLALQSSQLVYKELCPTWRGKHFMIVTFY